MTDNLLNELTKAGMRKPYALSTETPIYIGNIVITLDGLRLFDAPAQLAPSIVKLLNGANAEGTITGGQIVESFYQIKL
jgi:hypothetical protein